MNSKLNILCTMLRWLEVFLTVFALGVGSANAVNFTVAMTSDFQFSPKDLTVDVGDTVTWVNQSSALHDTTSGVNRVPNGVWRSPLFGNGGLFSFTFNIAPGIYPYYCTPHALAPFNMTGTITVLAPNAPPSVSIANPVRGATFTPGANVLIQAGATDDRGVARVEFFSSGNLIATDFTAPYSAILTNVDLGDYVLTAIAFDGQGLSTTSSVVDISVLDAPTVLIAQPGEGTRFAVGTNILIVASVITSGVAVASVQFFEVIEVGFQAISPPLTVAPYNFLWNTASVGSHAIMAVVTDEFGGTNSSALVSIEVFEPGTQNPTIAITNSPTNFARLIHSPVFISGVANDDVRLERVEFQVSGGPFSSANGTTDWSAEVALAVGTNVIHFRSVDFAGNISTNATLTFTYIVNQLTVIVNPPGGGRVKPNLNGHLLEIGKFYQMIARPSSGQIFGGWSVGVVSNRAILNFVMESNLVLTANFIPNPFPDVKGIYTGLIFETNNVRPETSGSFRLKVTSGGTFSGRLTIQNRNYPVHGQLDYSGFVRFPVLRRPVLPAVVMLNLDLLGSNGISGEVSSAITVVTNDSDANIITTNIGWSSILHGDYTLPVAEFNSGLRGREFRFDLNSSEEAFGSGAVQFSAARIRGRLSSGEFFNQPLFLSQNGQSPFYSSFHNGTAVLIGWLNLQNSRSLIVDKQFVFGTTNGSSAFIDVVPSSD